MTDQELKDLVASLSVFQSETVAYMRETAKLARIADEKADERTRIADEKTREWTRIADEKTRIAEEDARERTRIAEEDARERTRIADERTRIAEEDARERTRIAEERTRIADEKARERTRIAEERTRIADEKAREEDETLRSYIHETGIQMEKRDKKLQRMGILLGSVQQNQGDVAEEFFYKSLRYSMELGNMSFDFVYHNMHKHIRSSNVQGEYDIILVNGNTVAFIETKYKVHENDILKIKEKKVPLFKRLFPEYADYKLYAGIAGFHINQVAKDLASSLGYYVLERVGTVVHTNADGVHALK